MKKLTRVQAIKAKCLNCSNNQKNEIRLCAIPDCPLFDFRPYKTKPEIIAKRTGLPKEHYFKKRGKNNANKE